MRPIQVVNSGSPMCVRELLGLLGTQNTVAQAPDIFWCALASSKEEGPQHQSLHTEEVQGGFLVGRPPSSTRGDVASIERSRSFHSLTDSLLEGWPMKPCGTLGMTYRPKDLRSCPITCEWPASLLRRPRSGLRGAGQDPGQQRGGRVLPEPGGHARSFEGP